MSGNTSSVSITMPSLKFQAAVTISEVIDAMEVIGFQDQGKEKVAEFIQDKFQDLLLGKTDLIPSEFIEYADTIITVVEHLSKIAT